MVSKGKGSEMSVGVDVTAGMGVAVVVGVKVGVGVCVGGGGFVGGKMGEKPPSLVGAKVGNVKSVAVATTSVNPKMGVNVAVASRVGRAVNVGRGLGVDVGDPAPGVRKYTPIPAR